MLRPIVTAIAVATALAATGSQAATLSQTQHFAGASAQSLFDLYMTASGQEAITGLPASYLTVDGEQVERGEIGDQLLAFCFQPEQCGLHARVLDVEASDGVYTVVMAWWNFGWVSAADPAVYTVDQRGALDSTLVLTFRDTATGAQIELVQVNVPDYQVSIPSPDGTVEEGPLSQIVNTHWNTLYWDGVRRQIAN
ncbi:MAG: hypothetical protein AAFX92_05240 [Pseudomonadota bacterium]